MKVVVALSVVSVCAAVPFKKRNALTALAIAAVSTANVAGVDLVIPKLSKAVTNENWIESQEDTRVTDEKSFWGICRDTGIIVFSLTLDDSFVWGSIDQIRTNESANRDNRFC